MDTDKIFAEQIANEYSKKETSKVVALRKLDKRAKLPANVFAYVLGIVCTLLLGVGMCLTMGVIGGGSSAMLAVGVVVGVVGLAGMAVNYTVYKKLLAKGKEKYASDIITLAKQITDGE